jgi:hypothetical protein
MIRGTSTAMLCARQGPKDVKFASPMFLGSSVDYLHGAPSQDRRRRSHPSPAVAALSPSVQYADSDVTSLLAQTATADDGRGRRQGSTATADDGRVRRQGSTATADDGEFSGPGIYMIYMARAWMPLNESLHMSDVIGVGQARGGVLPPPLPPALQLHRPTQCSTPGCLRVWLRMTVPEASLLSPTNSSAQDLAYFARTVRCLHWGRDSTWNNSTCTFSNVTYEPFNGSYSLRVGCTCQQDGFVYADGQAPRFPPNHALQVSLRRHMYALWSSLIYLCTVCALCVLVCVLGFLVLERYIRIHISKSLGILSSAPINLWSHDPTMRSVEAFWASLLKPEIQKTLRLELTADEPTLKADFGVVSINPAGHAFWEEQTLGSKGRKNPRGVSYPYSYIRTHDGDQVARRKGAEDQDRVLVVGAEQCLDVSSVEFGGVASVAETLRPSLEVARSVAAAHSDGAADEDAKLRKVFRSRKKYAKDLATVCLCVYIYIYIYILCVCVCVCLCVSVCVCVCLCVANIQHSLPVNMLC